MAITRKEKEENLAALIQDIQNARGVVFTQYRGLTVKDMDTLRKSFRQENIKYRVVKVTLLKKALAALNIDANKFSYDGPLAVATSQDEETAPARLIKQFAKLNPNLVAAGGIFNQEIVDAAVVERLALLPSKQELLGQLVSVIAGPARGLVTVLSGNTRSLLNVLNAIREKKS